MSRMLRSTGLDDLARGGGSSHTTLSDVVGSEAREEGPSLPTETPPLAPLLG